MRKGNQLRRFPSPLSPALVRVPEFRRRWFRRHGRDLPGRRTRDPYHVMVSEFMLQQTQVSRSIESRAAAPSGMMRES